MCRYVFLKYTFLFLVEIVKPKVEIRKINDYGEQFCPMVTSPYSLTLVEHSEIRIYEGSNHNVYLKLIRLPTKPLASFVALADVHRKGSSNAGRYLMFLYTCGILK